MRFKRAIVASALVAFAFTIRPSAQTPAQATSCLRGPGEVPAGRNENAKANSQRASAEHD